MFRGLSLLQAALAKREREREREREYFIQSKKRTSSGQAFRPVDTDGKRTRNAVCVV